MKLLSALAAALVAGALPVGLGVRAAPEVNDYDDQRTALEAELSEAFRKKAQRALISQVLFLQESIEADLRGELKRLTEAISQLKDEGAEYRDGQTQQSQRLQELSDTLGKVTREGIEIVPAVRYKEPLRSAAGGSFTKITLFEPDSWEPIVIWITLHSVYSDGRVRELQQDSLMFVPAAGGGREHEIPAPPISCSNGISLPWFVSWKETRLVLRAGCIYDPDAELFFDVGLIGKKKVTAEAAP